MIAKRRFVHAVALAAVIVLLVAAAVSAQFSPRVFAINQDIVDGVVNVASATSDGAGWIVVSNAQGEVLGSAAIPGGISATIPVDIDASGVADGDTLTLSIYSDDGDGVFDAATDTPAEVDGEPVSREITVGAVGASLAGVLEGSGVSGFTGPSLNVFAAAVASAELTGDLNEHNGPYTIFAPDDAAFAAVTLPDDVEAQSNALLGHIVPGVFTTDVLTASQELATLAGTTLDVQVADDGTITVNGASIVTPDLAAYNGVIHVIDSAFLPVVEEAVAEATPEATEEPVEEAAATEEPVAEATPEATEEPVEEAAATEEPVAEATPEATEEAVEEAAATEEPVAEATPEATEEAVEEAAATEEPVAEATPEATEEAVEEAAATEEPVAEATPEATEEAVEEAAATEEPVAEATPEATEEAVEEAAATEEPVAEATPEATEEAVEEAAATEEPVAEATPEATEEAVEEAAATEEPVAEATPEATEEPVEEATAAPAEEAAATPAPSEEAPETLPATGAAPASPVTMMLVAGLVLVGLAIFAVAFRRRPA